MYVMRRCPGTNGYSLPGNQVLDSGSKSNTAGRQGKLYGPGGKAPFVERGYRLYIQVPLTQELYLTATYF